MKSTNENAYPEVLQVRLKPGKLDALKVQAKERGFSSMSELTRAALDYALVNEEFQRKRNSPSRTMTKKEAIILFQQALPNAPKEFDARAYTAWYSPLGIPHKFDQYFSREWRKGLCRK